MWKVREMADKLTNVVMNYTEIEAKVREATNDDPWGPTGTLRHELAQATFSYDQFPEVMGMLWKRIAENKRSPRRIYKSLLLVHHLLLNGSDRVVRATTDRLYEIRQLQDYHVVYEPGFNISSIIPVDEYKDGEMNVRVKAKEIVELVQDEERLREERKKAKKNRDKYVGIGSDRSMSKWNDFDDDLQFPRKSSSKYDDFEGDEDNSSLGGFNSKTSNNRGGSPSSLNIKLKSLDANKDDDDFNPRALESSSNSKSVSKRNGKDQTGAPSSISVGDFADFQSAFGGSGANNSGNLNSEQERHGLFSAPQPQLSSSSNINGSFDLLGLDIAPSIVSPAQTTQQVISSNSSTLSSSFDAFQGFQVGGVGSLAQNISQGPSLFGVSGVSTGPTFGVVPSSSTFQPFQSLQQQQTQSHQLLFGESNGDSSDNFGLLQPQQVNHINNNHVQGGVTQKEPGKTDKKPLVGTTWSDLNISIDDLSLSSKPKPSAQQPTMNQLLSSPSRSKQF